MDLLYIWLAFLALLFVVPVIVTVFQLLGSIHRWLVRWRHTPLVQKNHTRAGIGGFVIVAAILLAVYGSPVRDPFNGWGLIGLALLGLLYLGVGIIGSQNPRFDFMSLFWLCVIGGGCAVLLLYGIPV